MQYPGTPYGPGQVEYREDNSYFAKYDTFQLAGEDTNYTLNVTGYSGNAGIRLFPTLFSGNNPISNCMAD